MTGFNVHRWTGDSQGGQRFTVASALSLPLDRLPGTQRKSLTRKTQKRRGIWGPFPPHPEGRQGRSVAAAGEKTRCTL